MPLLALTLLPETAPRLAAALSFRVATPLPSRQGGQAIAPPAFYDLLPAEEAPALELAATEAAWAPTERLGL